MAILIWVLGFITTQANSLCTLVNDGAKFIGIFVLLKENHASLIPELIKIHDALEPDCFHQAMSLDIQPEFGSLSNFALDFNRSAHLFNDILADWQSKACALSISLWILVQLSEIYEQFLYAFLWNTYPCVYYRHLELDESFLSAQNSDWAMGDGLTD